MKIIGGSSTARKITLVSEEFTSIASCNKKGDVNCEIRKHSPLKIFFLQHRYLPIPQTIKMLILFFASLSKKSWLILTILIPLIIFELVFENKNTDNSPLFIENYEFFIIISTYLIGAIFVRWRIAGWHGAEHMVVSAFEKNGYLTEENIKKEDTFHAKCGGRLILPFIIVFFSAKFIADNFHLNSTILILIGYEIVMWINILIGWEKIPIFSHASFLLQKFISTKKPREKEIETAKRAIEELVATHAS